MRDAILPPHLFKPLKSHSIVQSLTALDVLSTAYCPLRTVHCLLPTSYCPLPTDHFVLPSTYCPLPTAHCPMSHVFGPLQVSSSRSVSLPPTRPRRRSRIHSMEVRTTSPWSTTCASSWKASTTSTRPGARTRPSASATSLLNCPRYGQHTPPHHMLYLQVCRWGAR